MKDHAFHSLTTFKLLSMFSTDRHLPLPALAVLWLAGIALLPTPLQAQETWDGGGADNDFFTNDNWLDDTAPVAIDSTNDIRLDGTTQTTIDLSSDVNLDFLIQEATAGPFTIEGSGKLIFDGGTTGSPFQLRNDSSNDLTLKVDVDWETNAKAVETLGGSTIFASGSTLTLNQTMSVRSGNSSKNTRVEGTVAGTRLFNIQGGGYLVLNAEVDSHTGGLVIVNNGTLEILSTVGLDSQGGINMGNTGNSADGTIWLGDGINLTQNLNPRGNTNPNAERTVGTRETGVSAEFSGNVRMGENSGEFERLEISTASGSTATFSGNINDPNGTATGGSADIEKTGTGTAIFSGANTYTGTTTVSSGTLLINGDQSASTGAVTVAGGATLGGGGTVGGATTISGTHAPGNSPGVQTFADDLSYASGSSVEWELVGNTTSNAPLAYDQIEVGGDLDFAGATDLVLAFDTGSSSVDWTNGFWDSDQSWLLFDVDGTTTNFGNLSLAQENWEDSLSQFFNNERPQGGFFLSQTGDDILLEYSPTAIPEPSAVGILGVLLGFLALRVRRCRRIAS